MALSATEICKTYRGAEGEVAALRPTAISLEPGQFTSLMGRSGSGKSTLLRILSGTEAPDSGDLVIDGRPITTTKDRATLRRGLVALVHQHYNLVPELTLRENVELAQSLAGQAPLSAHEVLDRVDVAHLAARRPRECSGGEQQRAAIARAMAVGARYLLADEPTGALDEENAHSVCTVLASVASGGTGVLVVTHDPLVASYASSHLHIEHGQVVG